MPHWMTTWAQAHTNMSLTYKNTKDYTARITVLSEFGGNRLRVGLSNQCGSAPAVVQGAALQIADREPVALRCSGKTEFALSPGESFYADPIEIPVKSSDMITISLAFKGAAVSGNCLPEYTRISTKGNYALVPQMPVAKQKLGAKLAGVNPGMPILSSVEVYTEEEKEVIVCFGDSITQQSQWTKPLADQLRYAGKNTVIINKGIGGNRLLSDPDSKLWSMFGVAAKKRFEEDVLHVQGVTAVLFALGINDLNMAKNQAAVQGMAEALMHTYEELSAKAKAAGLKTYIATVTPCKGYNGSQAFTIPEREKLNRMIRESTAFDAVVDFFDAVRDPQDPDRMQEMCDSGDHLHPGVIGGKKMAQAAYHALMEMSKTR